MATGVPGTALNEQGAGVCGQPRDFTVAEQWKAKVNR